MWKRLFRAFPGLFAKNDFSSENAKNRMDRDKQCQANRSRIAAYCQNCRHCKFDPQRGLLCALTDDYGDFQHECDQFEPSEAYIAKKRAERTQMEKEREQQSEIAILTGAAMVLTYIFCLVSMWHDDTPAATIQVLLAAGITLAGSGGAYYFYCRSQLKKITYGLLSHKKIVKLLHIEGYRPQLDAGGDILFQHDGNNYIIRAVEGHFMLYGNWICSDRNVEQLRTVANEVMEELRVVKVYANYDEEKMVAIVSFSVEAFTKYEVELQAQLSSFIHLLEFSSRQFFDVLQKNKPIASAQRRQSIYNREYGWFADVVDAVTDQNSLPSCFRMKQYYGKGFCRIALRSVWTCGMRSESCGWKDMAITNCFSISSQNPKRCRRPFTEQCCSIRKHIVRITTRWSTPIMGNGSLVPQAVANISTTVR